MFVPRTLRLKGLKERQHKTATPSTVDDSNEDALVDAMQGISTNSPVAQEDTSGSELPKKGPRFTVRPVTPEYLAQLAAGIELIFSDYALQEPERIEWLQSRYRTVEGQEKYIHLASLLEHPNISTLKPEATQMSLQQALQTHASDYIEVTMNGYYVRRKPSSYPPRFLPDNSFEVVDDDGLTFWDQRTIYVEPHMRNLCQTPAKVAQWLKEHGQLREKWLPVQAVHMLWNSCAFVVLSGSVMHEDIWSQWRAADQPEGWKIMTKVEHARRTAEYVELLRKENPRGMRRNKIDESKLPPIARPAALPKDVNPASEHTENASTTKGKRKRNRRKANKPDQEILEQPSNTGNFTTVGGNEESTARKRRK